MGCIMLSLLQIPFHFILLKKLIFVAADLQNGKYNRVVTLINGWLEEQQQNVFFLYLSTLSFHDDNSSISAFSSKMLRLSAS